MSNFFHRHSLIVNTAISVFLGVVCLISYVLIVLLYTNAELLQIESLVLVQDVLLKPTVVVAFLSAILLGSTTAVVTRAVEHSLWLRLSGNDPARLTTKESRRLAKWSVSLGARLLYLWDGQSWLLRCGGIVLFATVIMNPLLLAGITPTQKNISTSHVVAPTGDVFAGFIDGSNNALHGGNFGDSLMTIAALAQMSNVSAPSSSICTDSTCRFNATASAVQAVCTSSERDNPELAGQISPEFGVGTAFCSALQPELCVSLVRADPATYAGFASTSTPCQENCTGNVGIIFGAWVNSFYASAEEPLPVQIVECELTYGNVSVVQNGTSVLSLSRPSFEKSLHDLTEYGLAEGQWERIIRENSSSYTFTLQGGSGDGVNTIYGNPMASYLLDYAYPVSAETVARKIEKNYDFGTLFAFARAPQAARITVTITPDEVVWDYNRFALCILLLPFVATVLVLVTSWKVGNDDIVVGYDPVEIARRGPISLDTVTVVADDARENAFEDDSGYKLLNTPAVDKENQV